MPILYGIDSPLSSPLPLGEWRMALTAMRSATVFFLVWMSTLLKNSDDAREQLAPASVAKEMVARVSIQGRLHPYHEPCLQPFVPVPFPPFCL